MDQLQSPLEQSHFGISGRSHQINPDSTQSPFRIPRRPVFQQPYSSPDTNEPRQFYEFSAHKTAAEPSVSIAQDASEATLLDSGFPNAFDTRSIEALQSNLFTSGYTSDRNEGRNVKSGTYQLRSHRPTFYWKTPFLAFIFFALGIGLAVGHHAFLASLDGNPNSNQSWTGRFSLAFAFLTKTCFSAAIALAMKQVLWYTFRRTRRGVSISAIDAFFEIQQNPLKFLHFDIWVSGILATIFAVFLWLLPLVPLVSPTSLSTALTAVVTTNSQCFVPNIDFSAQTLESGSGVSLADAHGTDGVELSSPMAQKLSALTAYNGEILNWPSPCGSNCSYAIQFNGPAWQCTPSSNDNKSAIAPFGGNVTDAWGADIGGVHSPSYQAAFSNETGLYWVGTSTQGPVPPNSNWPSLNISLFYCENWNATFDIRVNYTSSIQTVRIQNITYLNNFSIPYILETAVSNGEVTIEVPPDYEDALHYNHAALFRSLGELMGGYIIREPHGPPVLTTSLASIPGLIVFNETADFLSGHYQPVSDLRSAIEELSRNLTISLLSSPVLQTAYYSKTNCYEERTTTVWVYDPWILWLPYGMAIVVTFGCLFVGGIAVFGNEGEIYDNSFSTVLRTTRNRDLDGLVRIHISGGQPLSRNIGATKLRLGILRETESATLDEQVGQNSTFMIVRR